MGCIAHQPMPAQMFAENRLAGRNTFGLRHLLGVFDQRMVRIYRAIGSQPTVVGQKGEGRDRISVGLWEYDEASRLRVAARAGISPELCGLWFDRAFGPERTPAVQVA